MSVEIISVNKSNDVKQEALARIERRNGCTPAELRSLPVFKLRQMQHGYYQHAQNSKLLLTLKEAVAALGTADANRAAKVWQVPGTKIEAALDSYAGLTVTVEGVTYCDDRRNQLPQIVFVPDACWIVPMLEAYEEAQFIAQQQTALDEDAERLALIAALSK